METDMIEANFCAKTLVAKLRRATKMNIFFHLSPIIQNIKKINKKYRK